MSEQCCGAEDKRNKHLAELTKTCGEFQELDLASAVHKEVPEGFVEFEVVRDRIFFQELFRVIFFQIVPTNQLRLQARKTSPD